jgi:2-iminobutanoate/2-iminopropanoate deaminase
MKTINPAAVAAPGGPYHHGLLLDVPGRWLFVSGQVPLAADGGIPDGIADQTEMVWNQIEAILADGGMALGNLVKITSFLTRSQDIGEYAGIRKRRLGEARPTSTLLVVSALANPKFLVEVEGIAFEPA